MTINVSNIILVGQNFEIMNSNHSKSKSSYNFDQGHESSQPKSLNDKKIQTLSSSYALYSYSYTQPKPML